MKIKHTYIDEKMVVIIETNGREEEEKARKFVEWVELCAEQPKPVKEEKEEKER